MAVQGAFARARSENIPPALTKTILPSGLIFFLKINRADDLCRTKV